MLLLRCFSSSRDSSSDKDSDSTKDINSSEGSSSDEDSASDEDLTLNEDSQQSGSDDSRTLKSRTLIKQHASSRQNTFSKPQKNKAKVVKNNIDVMPSGIKPTFAKSRPSHPDIGDEFHDCDTALDYCIRHAQTLYRDLSELKRNLEKARGITSNAFEK
jgi:hypothetical protein